MLNVVFNMSKKGLYQTIGENIIREREKKNMSQGRLAFLCDIDRSYMGKIEKGKVNSTLKTLHRISKVFKVDISKLTKP